MKLVVAERWPLEILERASRTEGDPEWWLDWYRRAPREASQHIAASYAAYMSVLDVYGKDGIESAHEAFGGVGAQSVIIQKLFALGRHTIQDYSAEAATHLKQWFAGDEPVVARQGDSYADEFEPADLVGLDFGDLTVWRTRDGEKQRGLLDRVFDTKPKAVVITDIAGPRLRLQRERYESLLGAGTCGSQVDYLGALSLRLEVLYGYRLLAGFYHRWSAVMAFVPEDTEGSAYLLPTPSSPEGLTPA